MDVELRVFTEPQQGATYETLLAVARVAEECGYGGFFRSDHYLHMGGVDGRPGPTDAWTTLAGLARDTSRIRLGTLVTPATFRRPGPLAVTVAQVDSMSGGRVELGIGAGWFEAEHKAFAIPFPRVAERFDRLEEQLEIITGLWAAPDGKEYSYAGRYYQIEHNPALVRPQQRPRPPIIIGGRGPRRTPNLAARFADEVNVAFSPPADCRAAYERAARACEELGRDPASLRPSAGIVVCCGSDETEVARRAAAIGREVDELKEHGAAGTPEEVAASIGRWVDAGARAIYLQFLDLSDLDHVRLVAAEVAPLVV
jgi:F420-dependent oxidoreductase-like protein